LDNGPWDIHPPGRIILGMTSAAVPTGPLGASAKAPPARIARRLVLVRSEPPAGRGTEQVRHYRLARLRLEPREMRGDERFAHLRAPHD
jgi:hypothetical protein